MTYTQQDFNTNKKYNIILVNCSDLELAFFMRGFKAVFKFIFIQFFCLSVRFVLVMLIIYT